MATPEQLRVAVVGSGPAGIYTADALTKQTDVAVAVDVLDRLPTPYGLVRYGVAPDHTSIKSIARYLQQVLERPGVRFLGCVELGKELTREDLLGCYHAVVYATGAMVDRRLGIPGEDLPGSVAATDFVNWYCGHPDIDVGRFVLDSEEIVVIGVGNVAVDVVRVLAKTGPELAPTDVPDPMLGVLAASRARRIHMVGRRGPAQAKFTTKELRELGALPSAEIHTRPGEMELDPHSAAEEAADRHVRANVAVLREWATRPEVGAPRRIDVRFWLRPVEILGTDRVAAIRLERTRLEPRPDGSGVRVAGTGEFEEIPAQMVMRSVGYQSVPLPGVPFDERGSVVPNTAGRVTDTAGTVQLGEYVAGWLKRGPTGVIGTNKSDAAETVRSLLADVAALRARHPGEPTAVEEVLAGHGVTPVAYEGWLGIEAAEAALARRLGRGDRVKLVGWEALRAACVPPVRRD